MGWETSSWNKSRGIKLLTQQGTGQWRPSLCNGLGIQRTEPVGRIILARSTAVNHGVGEHCDLSHSAKKQGALREMPMYPADDEDTCCLPKTDDVRTDKND